MNKNSTPSRKMVATKSKVLSCSTPEHGSESPSRGSDSEAASPVPFLCTQDGAEGETDVVWNFYTPKSEQTASSRLKNSTPLSRKTKKSYKLKLIEKPPPPKRKTVWATQKNTELFQDLIELNQNLHELIAKKTKKDVILEKQHSGSEDDIFNDSGESSPKSGVRANSKSLRRNLLSSKFGKPETETALESDDSMNECLIKASQIVEDKILSHEATPAKRKCFVQNSVKNISVRPSVNFKIDQDSMDAILNSIKFESPVISKAKKCNSPHLNNDSFDSFVGNLNDSALERLTQMPAAKSITENTSKLNISKDTDWIVQDLVVHNSSPLSKSFFGRHNSMPESPTVMDLNKPSTSGMVFGRYNSMPYDKNGNKCPVLGDSPIRCTPDEIKKKHQQAREKLLAKRLLPFTSSQQSNQFHVPPTSTQNTKKIQFRHRVASTSVNKLHNNVPVIKPPEQEPINNSIDLKSLIEKKRQEALMKLRRRQPHK